MATAATLWAAASTTTTRRMLAFQSCTSDWTNFTHHGRGVDRTIQRRGVTSFRRIRQRHYDTNYAKNGIVLSSLAQRQSVVTNEILLRYLSSSSTYHPNFVMGSNGCFEDPRKRWIIHPDLVHHTRSSWAHTPEDELENRDDKNEIIMKKDTQFSIICLGTGSGRSSNDRSCTATALRFGGTIYLFDAGEDVQRQILLSKLKMSQIQKIFITHLHADHLFGLPGLLLSLADAIYTKNTSAIEIYGPPGLYNYVVRCFETIGVKYFRPVIIVHELYGGLTQHQRKQSSRLVTSDKRSSSRSHDIRSINGLSLRILYPSNTKNGKDVKTSSGDMSADWPVWNLSRADEITTPEMAAKGLLPTGFNIKASEVNHVPNAQCFGYVVEEPHTFPFRFDVNKAIEAGVTDFTKYNVLKFGFPVLADDGSMRVVKPEEVLKDPERPKPRKVTILGDCCSIPDTMAELSRNSDVVIHEATVLSSDAGRRVTDGGHSSGKQAAQFACKVDAKVLLMNHLSPSVSKQQDALIEEASNEVKQNNKNTRVQVAYDFFELLVPRTGFQFEKSERNTESGWIERARNFLNLR